MNDVDERVLREVLQARSDQPTVPSVPIADLLSGGRGLVRRRRRRIVAGVGVAATVVAIVAGLALQPDDPGSHGPISPTPSTPTERPLSLSDLPRGELPRLPFAENGTLYVNGGTLNLEGGEPVLSVGGGDRVVVWTASPEGAPSPIRILDPETGQLGDRIADATSRPVVSADGRLVAWHDTNPDGTARVHLWDVDAESMLDPISFPFTPTCCDNPFNIAGIDADGNVYGLGDGKVWVSTASGRGAPVPLEGLSSSSFVAEVGVERVIYGDGPTTSVGHLVGPRLVQDMAAPPGQTSLSWDDSMLAYVDDAHTDAAGPGDPEEHVWVRGIKSGSPVEMRLPGDVTAANSLVWETAEDLLVEVTVRGGRAAPHAWVRCSADTGRCELATMFQGEAPSLPRR